MIYFENHYKGTAGLNNHVVPYSLCVSLSNFLDRDFYFDHEVPPSTPPRFAVTGKLKDKFAVLMNSPRSVVSDLVKIPNRRRRTIGRNIANKKRIDNAYLVCVSDAATMARFAGTGVDTFFSLGREILVKEALQEFDLIEIGDNSLVNATFFYFLGRAAKNELLGSIQIRYADGLERLAARICGELGRFNSMHLRLGDFLVSYGPDGYRVDIDAFRNYVDAAYGENDLPVAIATDGLEEKELFEKLLPDRECIFIDELIFENHEREFRELQFTDFSSLSVIDQLVCAAGEIFVGTCRSTFTSVIHRLRQERYSKTDFNFFPDERVAKLIDADQKIKPDQAGFFDWNRYSVFSDHYEHPAWMREWNYDLTSLS